LSEWSATTRKSRAGRQLKLLQTVRSSRSRVADLLIASTAVAHGLPIYTRNPADLEALASVVRVVAL